jgi:hypothetical protein
LATTTISESADGGAALVVATKMEGKGLGRRVASVCLVKLAGGHGVAKGRIREDTCTVRPNESAILIW